jgi:hypothetical protein
VGEGVCENEMEIGGGSDDSNQFSSIIDSIINIEAIIL